MQHSIGNGQVEEVVAIGGISHLVRPSAKSSKLQFTWLAQCQAYQTCWQCLPCQKGSRLQLSCASDLAASSLGP